MRPLKTRLVYVYILGWRLRHGDVLSFRRDAGIDIGTRNTKCSHGTKSTKPTAATMEMTSCCYGKWHKIGPIFKARLLQSRKGGGVQHGGVGPVSRRDLSENMSLDFGILFLRGVIEL